MVAAGGGASAGEAPPLWKQLLAFGVFATGNIGLNLFNTWALHKETHPSWEKPGFDFPIFYTMFHQIVSCVAGFMLCAFVVKPELGLPNLAQFWEYRTALIPIAICSALNAGLNNVGLSLVSLFVNQTIKAMQPLPTTFFSWALAGKKYTLSLIVTIVVIVLGNILALWNKVSSGSSGSSDSGSATIGIICCLISLLAASIRPVIMMILMSGMSDKPKLAPTTIMVYDSGFAFLLMLIYWVSSPELKGSTEYLSEHAAIGWTIIAVGSSVAFVFNLSIYYYVQLTSALTAVIGSNGIKIFMLIFSAILAGVTDVVSWLGISVVVIFVGVYGYLCFSGLQHPPVPGLQPPSDSEKGGRQATETTALKAP